MAVISVWKKIGETPLQATERARVEHRVENLHPYCFTGRLDPMAQGILISLFGDAVSQQDHFNSCNKVYRFHAVLGISTSSYDALGTLIDIHEISYDRAMRYHQRLLNIQGKFVQAFPPYSAMRYRGKPLWYHARKGTLPDVMPSKEREIFSVTELSPPRRISLSTYRRCAISDIKDVVHYNAGGEGFECSRSIKEWRELNPNIELWRGQYEITVSSGTYIRSLVHDLGQQLGIPAHASRITRTRIQVK